MSARAVSWAAARISASVLPASGVGTAPLPPFTFRLAGVLASRSAAPITLTPLGAQEAPRVSASTSAFSSASAAKKMRQSPSTELGSL